MAEVYVTKEAQQYSENIISQWLRDSGYDGSLEDGTSLYDVVVRPSSLIYTLFRQNIDKAYAYMSLSKANELRSVLSDEDYDAAIDGILSNWFVSRNAGEKAVGYIRLYFSRVLDFISFYDGDFIGSYGGYNFNARIYDVYRESVKAFNTADFKSVMNTTENSVEYYIDVPVISVENTDVDIVEGSVFSVRSPDIYFMRGVAAADFIPGSVRETSPAFIARTQEAITTRELITRRAFHTVLPDMFPEMRSLYVSGCGDSEMIRDIKEFQEVAVHVGNKADLWVGSHLVRTTEECTVLYDDNNNAYIELANSPVHVMSIVDNADPETYAVQPESDATTVLNENQWHYAMESIDGSEDTPEMLWFAPGVNTGKIYLDIPALIDNTDDTRTVTVHEITSTVARDIQEFITSDTNRVASFDPLVKMKVPVVMQFSLNIQTNVNYANPYSSNYDEEAAENIKSEIRRVIREYLENTAVYVESEMVQQIHTEVPMVAVVHLPVSTEATFFNMKTGANVHMTVRDKFSLDNVPANSATPDNASADSDSSDTVPADNGLSKQITTNTIQYYTNEDLISITMQ